MADKILKEFPLYSKVRLVADLTEGGFPVFAHPLSWVTENGGMVTGFTYGIDDQARKAGFDPSTPASEAETNIEKKLEVPGGGVQQVTGLSISTEGLVLIPTSIATREDVTKIEDGSHHYAPDILDNAVATTCRAGSAHDAILRLANRAFVPFVQYGKNGYVELLSQMQFYPGGRSIDDGRGAKLQGPIFALDNPLVFGSKGDFANLQFGLMLKRDIVTRAWVDPDANVAGDPGKTMRKLLGYAQSVAEPDAAGEVIAVIDLTLRFHGPRIALAGDASA